MKTITKFALLLLAAAAGNGAQAQQAKKVPTNTAYTIESDAEAAGTGISYQWYRDGQAISGANSASYTVPAAEAYGVKVEFKRGAKSTSCVGDVVFSNAIFLTFCALMINGVCWADCNVAEPGTFTERPDVNNTSMYQWNRYVPNDVTWNSTPNPSAYWTNNPCPEGWRLPTMAEFAALNSTGSLWVSSGTRGVKRNGRFYGPNNNNASSCTFPRPMVSCIFLPTTGVRSSNNGMGFVAYEMGFYWSSTHYDSSNGYFFSFNDSSSPVTENSSSDKATAYAVRCVQ